MQSTEKTIDEAEESYEGAPSDTGSGSVSAISESASEPPITAKIPSIDNMKDDFIRAYVHEKLSKEVGLGVGEITLGETWIEARGDPYHVARTAKFSWAGWIEGHYILDINRIFGLIEVKVIEGNLQFEVYLPKGTSEAFRKYLEAM